MANQQRIPAFPGDAPLAMDRWFHALYMSGLLFHPDDQPEDIVSLATGKPTFTPEECLALTETLSFLFEKHGDKVYEVALKFANKAMGITPDFSVT